MSVSRGCLTTLVLFLILVPVWADRITMHDGRVIEGRIVARDEKTVTIELSSGLQATLSRDEILEIQDVEEDASYWRDQAEEAFERERWAEAALAFQKIRDRTEAEERRYRIARRMASLDAVDGAERVRILRSILEEHPDFEPAKQALKRLAGESEEAFARARNQLAVGDEEAALEALAEAADDEDGTLGELRGRALGALADEAFFWGRYEVAARNYERLKKMAPRFHIGPRLEAHLYARFRTVGTRRAELDDLFRACRDAAQPPAPHVWARLGRLYERAGAADRAREAYKKALGHPVGSDSEEGRALARKPWPPPLEVIYVGHLRGRSLPDPSRTEPRETKRENWVIWHHDDRVAGRLLEVLPLHVERLAELLGGNSRRLLSDPIRIEIHRDRAAYMAAVGENFALTGGVARPPSRFVTWHHARGLLRAVSVHELCHLMMARLEWYVPSWFNEGVAQQLERDVARYSAYPRVWKAMEKERVDIEAFLAADALDAGDAEAFSLFYARAVTLVDMLVARHGGGRVLPRLAKELKRQWMRKAKEEVREKFRRTGNTAPQIETTFTAGMSLKALRRVCRIRNARQLQKEWRAWVKEIVEGKPWE